MSKLIVGERPRGEASASAKLSEEHVLEARRLWPQHSFRELADNYNVSHTCVRRAVIGKTWTHLPKSQ